MALKDLKSLIDNSLEAVFHRKEPSKEQLRAPLLKGIETATTQFQNGATRAANRWWKASNGVVALTVKLKGETFDINGVATNHFPEERFGDFMSAFKSAVEAGEFDAELANHGNGDAQVHIGKKRAAPGGGTRSYSEQSKLNIRVGGFRRGGMDDAAIRERLEGEGVEKALIDAAIARQPTKKA